MKAIILAAGQGTRLNKYTKHLPKGMLNVFGKSILQHQIDTYKSCGISDIVVVKGYCADIINFPSIKCYVNHRYAETNMVESLFCAEDDLNGDVIISYADVLFEERVLRAAIEFKKDVGVLVDSDWKDYWKARYGMVDFDTESLSIKNGVISELGTSNPPLTEIDGRYVGMIRLSGTGCSILKDIYHKSKSFYGGRVWLNGRVFEKVYMTDILQELINKSYKIYPIIVERGWLEFDTNEDYEKINELHENDLLDVFYKFKGK